MLANKQGKWATTMVFVVVLLLPIFSLLIMNEQLTEANMITSAAVVETPGNDTQIFAGLIIVVLVVVGLVSLFFKLHSQAKAKKKSVPVDANIDNLTEEIKKL